MPTEAPVKLTKLYEYAKDLATLIVIPLFLWVMKLESENAVRDEKIRELEGDIESLQVMAADLQEIKVNVAKVETKMDNIEGKVDDIYNALRGK